MKISLLLLLVFILQVNGNTYSQNQLVNLNLKNCSVEELFKEIKKQTGLRFVYKSDYVKSLGKFNIEAKEEKLDNVMERVFADTDVYCRFEDDVIVLLKRELLQQQQREAQKSFKGRVLDHKGEPLPGAIIVVKGATIGVAADLSGRFSIPITEIKNTILIVSFVGMESKEIKLSDIKDGEILEGKRDFVITLVESFQSMEDVVVTGFNNVKKESYTGDAVRVKGEDLLRVANRNIISSLEVFDPSLRISIDNAIGSNPNYVPDFSIRGESSIGTKELDMEDVSETRLRGTANQPLFIVDGLDVSVEYVYDLDPERIYSVTILKDAAATAIYGSRASNGVIVIETNAPKAGKFNISYILSGSVTAPDLTSYNYFNAKEKLEAEYLFGYYDLGPEGEQKNTLDKYSELVKKNNAIKKGVDTYWLSQPLRVGYNHKHSVAVDGGNDNIRYGITLGYDRQNGVMKKDYRNRISAGVRIDYRMDNLIIM